MRSLLVVFTASLVVGCSGARAKEPMAVPKTVASAPPSAVVPVAASAPYAPADVVALKTADEGPTSCPDGMALVDGDYCPEVEQTCVKEWWAESNKKHVCEEFEPHTECKGEKIHKRYCIDKYEWPNKVGERPEVMNRFHQAEIKCAAVGKRMCSESEWNFACEGPEMKPFPYGYVRDPLKCNGDNLWDSPNMKKVEKRDPTELARLWRGMKSGSQPECKSDFGVFDMPGNADEVVMTEEKETKDGRGKFDSIHTGGPWYSGVRNQCRPKVYTHGEDFYYYFLSFRCCSESDGKDTNPLTLRQQKDGWTIEKVEKDAQFTVAQMKDKLALKEQGKCECKDKDILCKTMCGTLLGPNAEDVTVDTPRVRYAGKSEKGNLKTETIGGDKDKPASDKPKKSGKKEKKKPAKSDEEN
jgi:sulfatase modifying factor 1